MLWSIFELNVFEDICYDWPSLLKVKCAIMRLLRPIRMLSPLSIQSQKAKFMRPTWGPPGSCRTQMGSMWAPWTWLSGVPLVSQYKERTYWLINLILFFLCGTVRSHNSMSIYNMVLKFAYKAAIANAGHRLYFDLTKHIPYLALVSEVCVAYCEYYAQLHRILTTLKYPICYI